MYLNMQPEGIPVHSKINKMRKINKQVLIMISAADSSISILEVM